MLAGTWRAMNVCDTGVGFDWTRDPRPMEKKRKKERKKKAEILEPREALPRRTDIRVSNPILTHQGKALQLQLRASKNVF